MSEDPGRGQLGRREDLLRLVGRPGPTFVSLDDGLARLEVWSQQRWDSTDECDRPARAEHVEGLGWVVAVPVRDAN